MSCEDEVPDYEQVSEDAALLELKVLVEDMAEEEKYGNEAIAANTSAAQYAKRARELAEQQPKEKKKKGTTKQRDEYMKNLFGAGNLNSCLQQWDDIFLDGKSVLSSAPTSSGPPSKCEVKSTKAKDTEVNAESDSMYDLFMHNTPQSKPFPIKSEEDEKIELKATIRANVVGYAKKYLETGSINDEIYRMIVNSTVVR